MKLRDRGATALSPAAIRDLEALDRALAGQTLAAEYGDLETLVRAVRDDTPPRDDESARRLERRVVQGFPRAGRVGRVRARLLALGARQRAVALAFGTGLAAVAAVVVVLVSAGGSGGGNDVGRPLLQTAPPGRSGAPSASPAAAATTGGAPLGAAGARAVQRDAALTLRAPRGEVQQVADRVTRVTATYAGIVQVSHVNVDDQGGSQADFQLQIPAANLDPALAAYSGLADVVASTQSTQDITDSTRAARDRLAEARAERLALLRQLRRATTPNQVASIRAQLAIVAGRIQHDDQVLQATLHRSRYATLQLTVIEGRTAGTGGGWTPDDALGNARDVLVAMLGAGLVGLAALVPLLLIGVPATWGLGALRRRRREQALGPIV